VAAPALHFPRLELGETPTPVRAAPGLGADVWLKDDGRFADLYWHTYGPRRNGG
jgi:hypothetical protein